MHSHPSPPPPCATPAVFGREYVYDEAVDLIIKSLHSDQGQHVWEVEHAGSEGVLLRVRASSSGRQHQLMAADGQALALISKRGLSSKWSIERVTGGSTVTVAQAKPPGLMHDRMEVKLAGDSCPSYLVGSQDPSLRT